jgi:hypothetical protein
MNNKKRGFESPFFYLNDMLFKHFQIFPYSPSPLIHWPLFIHNIYYY